MTRLYWKRPRKPNCSVCGIPWGEDRLVLHFNLTRVNYKPDGRMGTRGAGAIDLCERCWREVTDRAAIRRRPKRAAA